MFRVSKLTDYGTVLMTFLAQYPTMMVTAQDLALKTHLALPTVSKLLKLLAKCGLLQSHRGAKGGYGLAKSPEDISVASIIAALEGDLAMTECSHAPGQCQVEQWCHIRGNWRLINHTVRNALEGITLADMTKPLQSTAIAIHAIPEKPITITRTHVRKTEE